MHFNSIINSQYSLILFTRSYMDNHIDFVNIVKAFFKMGLNQFRLFRTSKYFKEIII